MVKCALSVPGRCQLLRNTGQIVQLLDREFRATQPMVSERERQREARSASALLQRPPRSLVQALARLVRAETTPALMTPVVVGNVLAWWQTGELNLVALVMALMGLVMSGWGFAALSDYADYQFSRRPGARPVPDPLYSGYGLIERAVFRPATVRDVGRILLAIGALCSLWLAVLAGWPILF